MIRSSFYFTIGFGSACFTLILGGCQKPALIAPAADPLSEMARPPMGAQTYNSELKQQIHTLDLWLSGGIKKETMEQTKRALWEFGGQFQGINGSNQALKDLAQLYMVMPELIQSAAPKDLLSHKWLKAKLFFHHRRFIQSAELLTEVLEKNPSHAKAIDLRARCLFFLGNPSMALSEFEKLAHNKALDKESRLDALYLVGAVIYESDESNHKQIQRAISAWNQYLKEQIPDHPFRAEIVKGLAELKGRIAQKDSQNPLPSEVFKTNPNFSPSKNQALTAFLENKILLALELVKKALKESPKDALLLTVQGRLFVLTGRFEESIPFFGQAIAADPNFKAAYHYSGMAHMMNGRVKEAIASWEKVVKLDKDYAAFHKLEQRLAVAKSMIAEKTIGTMK